MNIHRGHLCLLAAAGIFLSHFTSARADVRMPAIFGDHMVLQEKSKLPVWGWASPGEKITVTFKGQKKTTTAAANGTWRLDLMPVDPGSEAGTLTVAGNNTLNFTDVLVGDIWVASGQSNMEFGIQTDSRGKEAITNATDSQVRFFFVPWATALKPQTDIGPAMPARIRNLSGPKQRLMEIWSLPPAIIFNNRWQSVMIGDKILPAIFTTRKDCQPLRSERMTGRPRQMKNSSFHPDRCRSRRCR